jgi:ribose transport system substrate-binding protein
MTGFERRQKILRILAETPGIRVTQLAEQLAVSEGTIRNDLTALEEEQQVQRVRGGAVLVKHSEAAIAKTNQIVNVTAKERIARWAAEIVDNGDAIWLDAGTTGQLMVRYLQDRSLTVVTNGLRVAVELAEQGKHTVILVGGRVGQDGIYTVGTPNDPLLAALHLDTAFISGVGFSLDRGLTVRDVEDAQLKERVLAVAERAVALVDSTKFGQQGFVPFAAAGQLSHLVTDSEISPEFVQQMRRAGINLTICGENTVRSFTIDSGSNGRFTIGFANQSEELPFAVDVRRGLERIAAHRSDIDLVIVDNRLSGEVALAMADHLIEREVDIAIEYQIDYRTGNLIMDKFRRADIPVVAVDIPMVGATFFGVDNYRAGHMAGVALGEWVAQEWNGRIQHLLILEEPRAGSLPEARIQGQLAGLQEVVGPIPIEVMHHLDCGNTSGVSATAVSATLATLPHSHHIAIVCFNDEAAFGALQAARKAKRESDVVIVGQGADRLIHSEIRHEASRLIGSTAYMPERYGENLIELALNIVHGESVPPAVYMSHVFITKDNIDQYYTAVD